jgi:hypothetical protein
MSDEELIDFGILRDVDDQLDEEAMIAAGGASKEAIRELRDQGTEVEHGLSDILEVEEGNTDCVYCHYRAPNEEAIREHSKRAGDKIDTDAFTVSRLGRLSARDDFTLSGQKE